MQKVEAHDGGEATGISKHFRVVKPLYVASLSSSTGKFCEKLTWPGSRNLSHTMSQRVEKEICHLAVSSEEHASSKELQSGLQIHTSTINEQQKKTRLAVFFCCSLTAVVQFTTLTVVNCTVWEHKCCQVRKKRTLLQSSITGERGGVTVVLGGMTSWKRVIASKFWVTMFRNLPVVFPSGFSNKTTTQRTHEHQANGSWRY